MLWSDDSRGKVNSRERKEDPADPWGGTASWGKGSKQFGYPVDHGSDSGGDQATQGQASSSRVWTGQPARGRSSGPKWQGGNDPSGRDKSRDARAKSKTIRDGDWLCAYCGDHQFARNTTCRKCGRPKKVKEGADDLVGGSHGKFDDETCMPPRRHDPPCTRNCAGLQHIEGTKRYPGMNLMIRPT